MNRWSAGQSSAGADVHAPTGMALSCKGWEQEGALRMLVNCGDPDVAELGLGSNAAGSVGESQRRAARFRATVEALRLLEGDETLLVRAGAPAGVIRTTAQAPRVVIERGELRDRDCDEAADAGWLFVGTQTYLPALFEALGTAARKHFGGTFAGRLVVTCGMGGSGAALPLAATLHGAAFLGIDPDAERIKRRVKSGYCEVMVNDLDEALRILKNSVRKREAASVGLIGDCAAVIAEMAQRGIVPDLLVDCAGSGGIAGAGCDDGMRFSAGLLELRRLGALAYRSGGLSVEGGGEERGPSVGQISSQICDGISDQIFDLGEEYVRPLLRGTRRLLVWAALSGEPADIVRGDRLALDLFSGDEAAAQWIRLAAKHVQFQGLPARVCLVDRALLGKFAASLNALVAQKVLKAPVVIGCSDFSGEEDLLGAGADDSGESSVAGLSAEARGASWVSICGGGGSRAGGARCSLRAVVADGTAEVARKIEVMFGGGPRS